MIRIDLNLPQQTKRTYYEIIYNKNENIRLIKMNYRCLIQYTQNWIYNRSLNLEKVDELYQEIKQSSSKFGWTLHAFHNKSNEDIMILDGQHRREAIKKFIELDDPDLSNNDDILLWLYDIECEETNEGDIIDLFRRLNNNEPIDFRQLPSKRKIHLSNLIINEFKPAVRTNGNTIEARSPYISKKQIKDICDITLNKFPQLSNEEILLKMKEMNKKISILAMIDNVEELFQKKLNKKDKEIIDECFQLKFYLNIKNSIYDNFKWIDELV
jgi:hypothetical protein